MNVYSGAYRSLAAAVTLAALARGALADGGSGKQPKWPMLRASWSYAGLEACVSAAYLAAPSAHVVVTVDTLSVVMKRCRAASD
jgi:hypothetical protein